MASCYKCESRHPGCHSKCEVYIEAKAERDRIRKIAAQERETTNTLFVNAGRRMAAAHASRNHKK